MTGKTTETARSRADGDGPAARRAGTSFTVPCTVDLEHSPDSLHAYVDIGDVAIGPGDTVIVHDAPPMVPFGEKSVVTRTATVIKATPIERLLAILEGYLELTELYEVSFTPGRVA